MADDPTAEIVADHEAIDAATKPMPDTVAPDDTDFQAGEASQARETATRMRQRVRPATPPAPTVSRETPGEENPFISSIANGPRDNGIDNLERTRLNMVNSYYKGTVAGALELKMLANTYMKEDGPELDEPHRKVNESFREQYENIVTDLIRYDMMPEWSGLPQLGAAVGGTVLGSLPSPESFLGWASKGATWTARTMMAALQQGLISGATDPIIQHLNIEAGAQKDFDPTGPYKAFAFGAALGGGFHAAGEGAGHFLGQRELRRQLLDLSDVDPSVNSAQAALWRFDPKNGYSERVPDFGFATREGEGFVAAPPAIFKTERESPVADLPSWREAVEAERETLYDENKRWRRGGAGTRTIKGGTEYAKPKNRLVSSRASMVDQTAAYNAMVKKAEGPIKAMKDLEPADIAGISRFYERNEGETPQEAFDRAYDRYYEDNERKAMQEFGLEEEARTYIDPEFPPIKTDIDEEIPFESTPARPGEGGREPPARESQVAAGEGGTDGGRGGVPGEAGERPAATQAGGGGGGENRPAVAAPAETERERNMRRTLEMAEEQHAEALQKWREARQDGDEAAAARWNLEAERLEKMARDIEAALQPKEVTGAPAAAPKTELTADVHQNGRATPDEMAARERAAQKEEAEARMRGRKQAGVGQESAADTLLFGGERQGDLLGLRANREGNPMPGEERRDPNQGMPTSAAQPPLSPAEETTLRSLHRLALDLAEQLGVPLRQGRMSVGKDALGQYSRRSGVIRTREQADFEVVKHEAGHAIEAKVGQDLTNLTNQYRYEMAPLDYDQGPTGQRPNEGFAEWMRVRITNPREAQRLAPDFYNAFNALMLQKRPDILDLIGEIGRAHRAWLEAPSLNIGEAVVRNTIPDPLGVRATADAIRADGWAPTAQHVLTKFYEKIQDQYTHYVDRFADLERAVHDLAMIKYEQEGRKVITILGANDPSILIRTAHAAANTAMIESRFGMVPHRGTMPEGVGPAQIFNTALGKPSVMGKWDNQGIEHFDQYVTARMSEYLWRLADEGRLTTGGNAPSPIKPGDAKQIIADLEAKYPGFQQAAGMLQDFVQKMRDKAYAAGLWTADDYAHTSGFEFYVPMRRIFDEGERRGGGRTKADDARLASAIKKRRGSERDIDSPVRNIMRNLLTLEQDIRRNEINMAMLRLSESVPGEGGAYAERLVGQEAHKYTAPLEDMIKARAKEVGMLPSEARTMIDSLLDGEEAPLMGTYWRYETAAARGEPIVFGWENGKPIPIRLMSKRAGERYGLYEIMSATPPPILDAWVNAMYLGARTLRGGITNSPTFILTNYIKDQLQMALAQPGYIPFLGGLKGIRQELRQEPIAIMRAYFGGEMGGSLVNEVQGKFEADIRALGKQGYAVRHLTSVHGLMEAMAVTESGTRNSIFERTYKAKLKEGLSEYEAAIEAGHQANDIMAFSRYGDKMRIARMIVPFLGANIQGQDRYTFRTLIEPFFKQAMGRNVTQRDRENLTRGIYAWAMAGGGGLAFGAAWAALFWDKDAYRDATPEVKGTHIIVPMNDKDVFVMPKPFELGIGFTMGEYAYGSLAKKDPRMAEQMLQALMQAMSIPNPLVNLPGVTPALEMSANKSFYTGRPIVPEQVQNKAHPELEYTDRTSPLARHLGNLMGWSPMKVDYAMGAYFGTNGRDLMSLSGMVDQDSPTAALDDVVFARRFIKNNERISGRVRQFWDLMGAKNGKYHDEAAAYRKLVTEVVQRGQDPSRADALMKGLTDSERAYVVMHEGAKRDGKPAFTADDRRMHPLTRAYDAVRVLSGMATELQTNTLTAYRGKEPIPLSPGMRRELIDEIRTMAGAEMRNAFVVVKEKGYADRQTFDLSTYMDKIRQVSPEIADEIATRYATAKVYSFDAVRDNWPQMQSELASYGTDARLGAATVRIKGAGYEFHGTKAKRPGPVRQPIGPAAAP